MKLFGGSRYNNVMFNGESNSRGNGYVISAVVNSIIFVLLRGYADYGYRILRKCVCEVLGYGCGAVLGNDYVRVLEGVGICKGAAA